MIRFTPPTAALVVLSIALTACGGGGGGGGAGGSLRFPLSAPTDLVAIVAEAFATDTEHLVVADVQGRGNVVLTGSVLLDGAQCEEPVWSSDHRLIALRASISGSQGTDLFIVDPQRGEPILVSANIGGAEVSEAQWQPGGTLLAFRTSGSPNRVFVVRADGTGRIEITGTLPPGAEGATDFLWSPDGTRLALRVDATTAGSAEVVVVFPDGTGRVTVSGPAAVAGGGVSDLLWAPDSTRLAFTGDLLVDGQVELFSAASSGLGGRSQLNGALPTSGNVFESTWAPDASRIAFLAPEGTPTDVRLFTCLPDGTGRLAVSLPAAPGGQVLRFAWSPDSARLAYIGDVATAGVFEAFTVRPTGADHASASGALVGGGDVGGNAGFLGLAWSPDSTRLAFGADAFVDGQAELLTALAAGGGRLKHTDALRTPCDVFPLLLWNPASTRVAFRADHLTSASEPFVAAVAAGSASALGDVLGDGAFLDIKDWSVDGSRLVVTADDGSGSNGEVRGYAPDASAVVLIAGPFAGSATDVVVR